MMNRSTSNTNRWRKAFHRACESFFLVFIEFIFLPLVIAFFSLLIFSSLSVFFQEKEIQNKWKRSKTVQTAEIQGCGSFLGERQYFCRYSFYDDLGNLREGTKYNAKKNWQTCGYEISPSKVPKGTVVYYTRNDSVLSPDTVDVPEILLRLGLGIPLIIGCLILIKAVYRWFFVLDIRQCELRQKLGIRRNGQEAYFDQIMLKQEAIRREKLYAKGVRFRFGKIIFPRMK